MRPFLPQGLSDRRGQNTGAWSSGRMRIQHLPLKRTERDLTRSGSCEITLDVVEPHSTDDWLERQLLAVCSTPFQSPFGANLGTRRRSRLTASGSDLAGHI